MNMMAESKYRYFIQQYKNKIYTYSIYMLKNRMDADDVTQEVLIRIWKNIDGVNFLSAKTWIMKSTHNLCIDVLRKRAVETKREVVIDEYFEETFEGDNSENDPFNKFQISVMSQMIKDAIQKLPGNLKSVFVLYEIHNLKYKEISKTLDIPLNSVRVYLLRARKKLQEEINCKELKEVV
jgi:RNA polymerase sigma factor (sigma-70 family)